MGKKEPSKNAKLNFVHNDTITQKSSNLINSEKNVEDSALNRNSIKNNWVYKKDAVDSYVHVGRKTATLALNEEERIQFFQERPPLEPLLKREMDNPLLEEGKITMDFRERKGELYLTHEAITLLVEKKIMQHQPAKGGLAYDKKNIFIIKNDTDKLKNILEKLNLKNNEDAKFIYITGIHSIPFYLRKENEKIKCFIVDPEPVYRLFYSIVVSLNDVFFDLYIVLSQTHLQKDFYSCSTFAIKALMYFVKHGHEIFPQLEDTMTLTSGLNILPASDLMPTLLKMSQSTLDELSDTALDAIVSQKKQKTLRQYFSEYSQEFNNKIFNTVALEKKYKYFSELNGYIQSQASGAVINEDNNQKLPDKLAKIHEKFSSIPIISTSTTSAVTKAQLHNALFGLFGSKDYPGATEEAISGAMGKIADACKQQVNTNAFQKVFKNLCAEYFPRATNSLNDKTRIQDLRLALACLEKTDFVAAKKQVDILHSFLGNYANVARYLKLYGANPNDASSIARLCSIQLPGKSENWNKERWIKLIFSHQSAISYLPQASAIEKAFYDHPEKYGLSAPINSFSSRGLSLTHVKAAARRLAYKKADIFPELADLCLRFKKSEAVFEACLAIQPKEKDDLPAIKIDGSDLGHPEFTMMKLPAGDIRGFFLGDFTHCCQHISGDAKSAVVDGMTQAHSGFYVIIDKQGEIVAQSWAWITQHGEFIFDSFEHKDERYNFLCSPFYEAAAKMLIAAGFNQVFLGKSDRGGNTPHNLPFKTYKKKPSPHPVENIYTDIKQQYVIHSLDTVSYADNVKQLKTFPYNLYPLSEEFTHFCQSYLRSNWNPQIDLNHVQTIFSDLPKISQSQVLFIRDLESSMSIWLSAIKNNRDDLVRYYLSLCSTAEQHRLVYFQYNRQTALNLAQQHPDSQVLNTLLNHIPINKQLWSMLDKIENQNSSSLVTIYLQWFQAIEDGKLEIARQLLINYPQIQVAASNVNGLSALHIAAMSDNSSTALIEWLTKLTGINLDEKAGQNFQYTPAQLAQCFNSTGKSAQILRKKIGITDSENLKNDTPLHVAVSFGLLARVKDIIEKENFSFKNLEKKGRYQSTPLRIAIRERDQAVVNYLLQKGAKIDPQDNLLAMAVDNTAMIKLLLNYSSKTKTPALIDNLKKSIYASITYNYSESFKLLLQQLGHYQEATEDFIMDLFVNYACGANKNNIHYVDYLLDHYKQHIVDINACISNEKSSKVSSNWHQNALSTAVKEFNLSLVEKLDCLNADFHQTFRHEYYGMKLLDQNDPRPNIYRQTLLHIIATQLRQPSKIENSINLLRYLISKGIPLNAQDSFGNTALHYAAHSLQHEMIHILHEHGADPTVENSKKQNTWDYFNLKNYPGFYTGGRRSTLISRTHLELEKAKKQENHLTSQQLTISSMSSNKNLIITPKPLPPLVEQSKFSPVMEKAIHKLLTEVKNLQEYGVQLEGKHAKKGALVQTIANEAHNKTKSFFEQDTYTIKNNFPQFGGELRQLINSQNDELGKYRINPKTIIANICIALTGVGALAIAVKLTYSKMTSNRASFFFSSQMTTSEAKVKLIEDSLRNIPLSKK